MNVETNIWVYIMNYPQMNTKHSQAVGVDIVALTDDASLDRFINRNHINDYRNYQCSLYALYTGNYGTHLELRPTPLSQDCETFF